MEKPVLTISLLCSGREGTKKCLDSLEMLRKRVSSELILVDTGCDMEMRELLCTYAEEVVDFAWCGDFSKARNAGLKKASGEWFLYLDDDESFVDTAAIEEFFLSGEYKNFGYAAYTVRNFSDEELKNYQDSPVVRLYSLRGKGGFRGAVHESFVPMFEPAKILNCIAEHTGYIYRTPADKIKHTMRNMKLLERAVSEETGDTGDAGDMIRLRAHLAQEYLVLKDYNKLRTLCRETLQKFEKQDDRDCNRHRGCFYGGEILAEMLMEKYEVAYQAYRRAICDKRNTGYTTAYLMTQGAELFWRRGEKEKAAECCKRYLELCEYYEKRPEKRLEEQTFFVITAFYNETKSRMYCYQICFDLEKQDTSSLKDYFDLFGWEKDVVYMTEDFMPCIVKAMVQLDYDGIFAHVAEVLINRPGMDNFREEIEKIKKEEELCRIVRVFSEMREGMGGKAAAYLKEALLAEQEDEWGRFSAALKEAAEVCPIAREVLKCYAIIYAGRRAVSKENENKQMTIEEERGISAEMRVLADQIKEKIPVLLAQGMEQEALQILEQIKAYMPGNEEEL